MNRRSGDDLLWLVVKLLVPVALFAVAVGAVASFTALSTLPEVRHTAEEAKENSKRLDRTLRRLEKVERLDTRAAREAAYRNCARDMLNRAEQYVAQETAARNPLIRAAFPAKLIAAAQARRRRNFPIIGCKANLRGEVPKPLSAAGARRYVRLYAAGRLDPNPAAPR